MAHARPPIELVLVHGTFARDAAWTLDCSPLRKALMDRFGERAVFSRFVWSGRNSFRARAEATTSLRQFLTESHPTPVGHRFIIAHSHGGNIAFEALTGPEAARDVDGLVCLSTPFLLRRPRSIPALVDVVITVVGVASALIALVLLFMLPIVIATIPIVAIIVAFRGAWLPGLIGLGVGSWLAVLVFRKMADLFTGFGITPPAVTGPKPPLPDPKKVLILQSAGDEAAAALTAPRLANRLVTVVFLRPLEALAAYVRRGLAAWERWPHLLSDPLESLPRWFTTSILVIPGSGLLGLLLGFAGLERTGVLLIVACGGIGAALAVYELGPFVALSAVGGLVSLLALPVMVLFFVAFLPFGYDIALVSLFFEVDANTTPPGSWTVRLISSTPRFLAHSETYDNSAAVSAVTDWISSRLDGDTFSVA